MKFSVLIPVYNAKKYLEECLLSVLNQTYQDFEIILVDDGSTDESGKICDKYHADYSDKIKVIHQVNQGQLTSRCNAIKAACGEYCVFADADDLLAENALEMIHMNLSKFDEPDMLIYSFFYEDENGCKRKAKKLFDDGRVEKDRLYQLFYTDTGLNNVWTKAVKREIALCKEFDFSKYYGLRCSEDKLHSMVMVDGCREVVYIYENLYRYRLFAESTTRQYSLEKIDKFNDIILFDELIKFAEKWGLNSEQWKTKIEINSVNYMIYVFDLFFLHTSPKKRKELLAYDWASFLPDNLSLKKIEDNGLIPQVRKDLARWIVEKNETRLKMYYFKKSIYQSVKKIKRKSVRSEKT